MWRIGRESSLRKVTSAPKEPAWSDSTPLKAELRREVVEKDLLDQPGLMMSIARKMAMPRARPSKAVMTPEVTARNERLRDIWRRRLIMRPAMQKA